MQQLVSIQWYPVQFGEMPDAEGTYMVAFSDGSVESYPMDIRDIQDGAIHCGSIEGEWWAASVPHPERSELFLDISELISE
jgi:hypothetical protein